jgi:hypothetical protein
MHGGSKRGFVHFVHFVGFGAAPHERA